MTDSDDFITDGFTTMEKLTLELWGLFHKIYLLTDSEDIKAIALQGMELLEVEGD